MIFSLDAAISFTILLIGVLVFANVLANTGENALKSTESFELEEKALLIADSMVKNYDENNTLLGACVLDTDKKRVLTNQISTEKLRKAKKQEFGETITQSISVKTPTRNETITLDTQNFENCVAAKRFALIDGEKGIVEVKTCKK